MTSRCWIVVAPLAPIPPAPKPRTFSASKRIADRLARRGIRAKLRQVRTVEQILAERAA